MGDPDEYTTSQPEPTGPAADPQEPVVDPAAEHEFAVADPIAAIQAQLLMEDLDQPSTPTGVEPVEVGPDVELAPEAPYEPPVEPLLDGSAPPEAGEKEPDIEPCAPEGVAVDEGAVSDEDLAAAVAASNESVGDAEIILPAAAAEPVAAPDVQPIPDAAGLPTARYGAPWWPYFTYFLIWAAVAGVGVWQFQLLPAGQPIYEAFFYRWFLFAGLVLSALGPVLVLAVWLACRESENRQRRGLFTSALLKGAFFTLLGVIVWWGTLLAVDFLRFGRLF